MKKVFIRAGISPLDNFDYAKVILNNSIGNNSGNLIYAYSMFRTLMTQETKVIANYYKIKSLDANFINDNYDSFVIPLADAFRSNFAGEMKNMTELITKLKIPCVVVGVGLRLPLQESLDNKDIFKFKFNKHVKKFVKAVLDKSAIIGVRGQITGDYLKSLGFKEERDYTVIGCPSMYAFGRELKVRDTNLTKESRICYNNSILCDNNIHDFIERTRLQIPDNYFIPQRIQEFRLLYNGAPYIYEKGDKRNYPLDKNDKVYKENRARAFANAGTWFEFLQEADFSFGSRLHGNIAAILAGTKSLLIPYDSRMSEITNYHNLPHIKSKDINEKTDIFELFAKTNFNQIKDGHDKRFDHFINFLEKNGLNHIYEKGSYPKEVKLDKEMSKLKLKKPLESSTSINAIEKANRKCKYNFYLAKKVVDKLRD